MVNITALRVELRQWQGRRVVAWKNDDYDKFRLANEMVDIMLEAIQDAQATIEAQAELDITNCTKRNGRPR